MDQRQLQPGTQGQAWSQGNTMAISAPTTVSSPVRDAISGNESWLSDLHNAVDRLEQRLDTILTPVPPQTANGVNPATQGPPVSHVQGRLRILNEGYNGLMERLSRLHDRIEL